MTNEPTPSTKPTRPWYAVASIAAVAVVVAIAFPALTSDTAPSANAAATPPLELSLGEGAGAMASCLPFDVAILADMPLAFEGTVSAIEGEQVTLAVDHWFKGGDGSTVELSAPAGMQALIGGIDFDAGSRYLVSASDGVVNYCGYSGLSTTEYRAAFEAAFAG